MKSCWARALGDCRGAITKEHFLTRAILGKGPIEVDGLPWAKDQRVTVPAAGFARHMLCDHHNAALSPVDSAGLYAFRVLSGQLNMVSGESIDGLLLERWCMKTAINTWYLRDDRSPGNAWHPPSQWVAMAFGREPVKPYAGLYLVPADSGVPERVPGKTRFAVQARHPLGQVDPIAAVVALGNRYVTIVLDARYELREQEYRPTVIQWSPNPQHRIGVSWGRANQRTRQSHAVATHDFLRSPTRKHSSSRMQFMRVTTALGRGGRSLLARCSTPSIAVSRS